MAAPLILARTFKDAHAYASDVLGLRFGNYRVVNSVGTIKATRGADLHLVPGWDKRPDRFTLKGALRYARHNIIDASAPAQEPAPVDPSARWSDLDYVHKIALRCNSLLEASNTLETENDVVGDFFADVPAEDPEPTATCIDCGLYPHDPECVSAEPPVVEGEPTPAPVPTEDENPDFGVREAPKKRRRRKCADCEQLHYKGDPCIDSEAL